VTAPQHQDELRPEKLRSQLLSDAFADNVSTIRNELRPEVRPGRRLRRHVERWGPRASVIAVSIGMVLAFTGVARRQPAPPSSGQHVAASPSAAPAGQTPRTGPSAGVGPDIDDTRLSRAVDPGVLELGVRRVVLDAGHGGENPGTASASGLQEKDLTLDIAERARRAGRPEVRGRHDAHV